MTIIFFLKKLISSLAVAVFICSLNTQLFAADKTAQSTDTEKIQKLQRIIEAQQKQNEEQQKQLDIQNQVQGEVSDSFRHNFSISRITSFQREDQSTVTKLVGRMRDQAELSGLLNSLYELHLPIISVHILSEDNDTSLDFKKTEPRLTRSS